MVAANEAGVIPLPPPPPPPPPSARVPIPLPPPPPPPTNASAGGGTSDRRPNIPANADAVAKCNDRVDVDGQSVPSAIASAFSDPSKNKKPFSYFEGGRAPDLSESRPSAVRQSHQVTTSLGIPKVLPLFSHVEKEEAPSNMPVSHLQYNSPLPLYSKESAQESYNQQVGPGAPVVFGSTKEFDPARSKTLQVLKEQEEEARHRPTTPHSAQYDEPGKDDPHPHYHGYVNPNQQSSIFKRLQYATNGTNDGEHHTGASHHPTDPAEVAYSTQHYSHGAPQHVPMVAMHDSQADGERDHPLDPNFSQKIAAAERPNVPVKQEPSWTHMARNKQQKWDRTSYDPADGRRSDYREPEPDWARRASPQPQRRVEITRPYSVPPQHYQPAPQQYQQQYYQPNQYDDHQYYYDRQNEHQYQERLRQQEREQQKYRTPSPSRPVPRGYEMGGTDYNPPHRWSGGSYYGSLPSNYRRRAKTPDYHHGYEFGGTDYGHDRRRHQYYGGGNYHGYGPESPRRRAKSQEPGPRPGQEHWLRTYVAPNVDQIHSRGLVGDTRSNMHLGRETTPTKEQRETFGTYFGPTEGFKAGHRHRDRQRSATLTEPPTFSISAPKLGGQRSYKEAQQAQAYERAQKMQQASQSSYSNFQGNKDEYRNMVAVPNHSGGAYQSGVPRKQEHGDSVPTWAQTAQRKRADWEMKASATEARTQLPAAYKVPSQPSPHWAQQAEQKHSLWQSEFDRHASGAAAPPPSHANSSSQNQSSAFQTSSSSANRMSQYSSSANYQSRQHHETSTRSTSQPVYAPSPVAALESRQESRQHHETSTRTASQPTYAPSPVASMSSRQESQQHRELTSTRTTSQPAYTPPPVASMSSRQESQQHREMTSTRTTSQPTYAPSPVASMSSRQESRQHHETSTRTASQPTYAPSPVASMSSRQESRQHRELTSTRTTSQPAYTPPPVASMSSRQESRQHREMTSTRTTSQPAPVLALPAPSTAMNQSYSSNRTYSSSTSGGPQPAIQPTGAYSASYDQNNQSRSMSSWQENKPWAAGSANTQAHTTGSYIDPNGHQVSYKKEMVTSSDPGKEYSVLTEEERKVMEEPIQPGVISRHVTTKYYKKSTFTDSKTTTTATNQPLQPFDRHVEAPPKPGQIHPGVTQF